jgi:hypothetical protein
MSNPFLITGGLGDFGTPAPTPAAGQVISCTAPYCTRPMFVERYDIRSLRRLLSDDDAVVLTPTEVLNSSTLYALLMAASGVVEAACFAGGRYTCDDLRSLQSPDMTNGGELLASLVADLAMWSVWRRRPRAEQTAPVDYRDAQDMLRRLESGDAVFGLQAVADAGRLDHQRLTPTQVIQRNDRTIQAARLFGRRSDRDPWNQ